jgi:hypothetical protein
MIATAGGSNYASCGGTVAAESTEVPISSPPEGQIMRISLSVIGFLVGLSIVSTNNGVARGQEERGELPDGIRQLIRAADLADQQAKREGSSGDDEAARKARQAHAAARRAISDYYSARFEFDRASAATLKAQSEAAEADSKLIEIQNEAVPNPPRQQRAQEDRDTKLRALAEVEIKMESARQAFNAARNPSGAPSGSSRPGAPPALPVPDFGGRRPGGAELIAPSAVTPTYGCRFVYSNDEGSFHLANQTGTAYYTRFGQPHIVSLVAVRETPNFFWYSATSGDPAIIEWAFAKYPEFPGFDWTPRFAVWCHDRAGWHWEWSCREAVCDYLSPGIVPVPTAPAAPVMPSTPLLLPGPATFLLPTTARPVVLVAERP